MICTYSTFLAHGDPTCCVSFSSYYNDNIVPISSCSGGCKDNKIRPGTCIKYPNPVKLWWSAISFEFDWQDVELIDYFVP